MRALLACLLLATASIVVATPSAGACHVVMSPVTVGDYYVEAHLGLEGCPHRVAACVEAGRDGVPFLLACPLP